MGGAAAGDLPLLLVLAVLLAAIWVTASRAALRRMRRGAAFVVGAVVGVAGAAGLAGLVVLSADGPDALRGIGQRLTPALPLPNIIRPSAQPPPLQAHAGRLGHVTHVRDGDTIEVNGTPIRFANVDCAERGSLEGDRATAAMRALVRGRSLRCDLEGRRSYDREIGTCYLEDGRDLGGVLVAMGLCHWR
jgi:hypothetical protein